MARRVLQTPASNMVVVTPSYVPDIELFADLHASVLRHFPVNTKHYVVVPPKDVRVFRRFEGSRCEIVSQADILPRGIVGIPGVNGRFNIASPWPPLRGWVIQQMVKLGLANHLDEDLVVLADSDIFFVRAVTCNDFSKEGVVNFYRLPDAITDALPRHLMWTREAHRMLGLELHLPPYADYVSALNTWDRRLVLALQRAIEEVSLRRWSTEFGRRLQVSEFVLYGTFVQQATGGRHPAETPTMRCLDYWDPIPLDRHSAARFLASMRPDDIAVMFSAKSKTPLDVRRSVLRDAGYL